MDSAVLPIARYPPALERWQPILNEGSIDYATKAILRPFMEMFISIASFIWSSVYLCVMRSVIGKPRSCDYMRKSKLCTQSLA